MKRHLTKITSFILCFCVIISIFSVSALAENDERITDCDKNCEWYPTIIIPGLGQSGVHIGDGKGGFLLDKDGKRISAFPAYVEVGKIVKRVAFPLLSSLVSQRDFGLSDAVADAIEMAFGINGCDLQGQLTGDVHLERMPYPLSRCNERELREINSHIPFQSYHTDLPYDHIYYFSYNSFGNHIDMVDELFNFIHLVKRQTGHDIINLVPISQGATISNGLFEYYPEIMDSLHKVIYIVPAIDGSNIIGDVFTDRINFLNKDYLYNGFLEELTLLDEWTARLIEILVRILPDEIIMASLNKAAQRLIDPILVRSTSIWTLCPSGDYEAARERHLSKPEMADIKRQTDKYYQAQLNAHANIKELLNKGVQVFNVAEYDYHLINVGERWNTENADFIIQLNSTSMGAYAANVGEQLPAGYQQKNTHCSNPAHNHISPDFVVDASSGLLPDTTFYFKEQRHESTQFNDVILKIAFELIAHDDIKDVYSSEKFPQFNIGRNVRKIKNYIKQIDALNTDKMSNEEKEEAQAAVLEAQAILDSTIGVKGQIEASEERLENVLIRAGKLKKEKEKSPVFLRKVSLWLYGKFGTNGFSEMPLIALKNFFARFAK